MEVKRKNMEYILYGESKWCRYFYERFADIYTISEIVYTENVIEAESYFQGMEVPRCQYKEYTFEHIQNKQIIVCPGDGKKEEHDTFLYSKGYIYGVDYIDSLYVEYNVYKNVKQDLVEKNIWIFGAGKNGKKFYEINHEKYHIKGFLSNYDEEKTYMGLPVLRPSELVGREDIYIVICSAVEYEMAEQLRKYGFGAFETFVLPKWIDKKLFIGWGSCQVYSIYNMLLKNPAFERKYDRIFVFDSKIQECNHADKQRIYTYGDVCDVLFYNSDGMIDTNAGIVNRFYKNADVYNIPFYSFRGQIMQATEECSEYSLRYEKKENHFSYWFIGDVEIEKMIQFGMTKGEILSRISDTNYWSIEQIQKRWQIEKRKVSMLDRLSSLKVTDYLMENYRDRIIFKDGIHFCKELCIELANQLAFLLKLEPICQDDWQNVLNENYGEDKNTLPIYPAVICALEMNRCFKDMRYQVVRPDGTTEEMDFEHYAGMYIDYIMNVDSFWKECGIRVI